MRGGGSGRQRAAAAGAGQQASPLPPLLSSACNPGAMSLVPLAVIGFCTAVAVVGELLQASDGGWEARDRLLTGAGHRAACRRRQQASLGRSAVRAGRSRCRSAPLAPAQCQGCLGRPMARPACPPSCGWPHRRRRCRRPPTSAPASLLPQWFFVWRTPAFQALKANLAKHSQKVEDAKEVRAAFWAPQLECRRRVARARAGFMAPLVPCRRAPGKHATAAVQRLAADVLHHATPLPHLGRAGPQAPRTCARRSSGWSSGAAPRPSRLPSST